MSYIKKDQWQWYFKNFFMLYLFYFFHLSLFLLLLFIICLIFFFNFVWISITFIFHILFNFIICPAPSQRTGTILVYIYIYRAWLLCLYKHISTYAYNSFLHFQCSNGRSEPFILFSILICAWRPNFTFFWIFLLFIKYFTKLLIQHGCTKQ
jgi:hypothetical protein